VGRDPYQIDGIVQTGKGMILVAAGGNEIVVVTPFVVGRKSFQDAFAKY